MFYQLATDGTRTPATHLLNSFAGPLRSPCWIIGGGPSLPDLDCQGINDSPVPRFAFNLNGHGLIRPDLWTYYDTTNRFHRSTFLDARILKFAHSCRATDLIPGTSHKVCDAPRMHFFDRDQQRGFHNFLPSTIDHRHSAIIDWNDSLVQTIDIAYRLGFRTLYLVGTDMIIRPTREQLAAAGKVGVAYEDRELLRTFYDRWSAAGVDRRDIDALNPRRQYHFDESKSPGATCNTDLHYFRVAQYLRLSQRAISLAGLDIISCTPGSRLNDYFEFIPVERVLRKLHRSLGNPLEETTRGRYTESNAQERPGPVAPMRDFKPHHWPARETPSSPQQAQHPAEIAVPAG